ncbi:MAG: GNAT family N-acetyltransferase, partial [Candidatus Lokiarchaeota archaeon]
KMRPVKPTDERMLQELLYSLDEKDRYYRFFSPMKDFRHKRVQPMILIDYSTSMIIVAVNEENEVKEIVAEGGFFKTNQPSTAEIAFAVHKDWRNFGITKFLLDYLVQIARELKYKYFNGSILLENKAMLHIIDTSDYPMTVRRIESGVTEFKIDITKKE